MAFPSVRTVITYEMPTDPLLEIEEEGNRRGVRVLVSFCCTYVRI